MFSRNSKLTLTLILSIFLFTVTKAQKLPEMVWNKVEISDLKMTHWASDSTAEAVILGDFGQIYMTDVAGGRYTGFELKRHYRVKIFSKSAFDRANITIPFYSKDEREYIREVKAQTILPDGTRIPLDKKSFITEKLNNAISNLKFTFTNVTEGVILEYEVDKASKDVYNLDDWSFQHDIPIRNSCLKMNLEARFGYTYLYQGKDKIIATEVEHEKTASDHRGFDSRYTRTKYGFYTHELPALKVEPYVSTIDNYRVKIKFQLAEYFNQEGIKIKNLKNWDEINTELLNDDQFGENYLKEGRYDDVWKIASTVLNKDDSTMLKVDKLYNWVNENIEWNKNHNWFTFSSPNELLKKRKGNSAELNLTLVALLRQANINANPVILSTRDNGFPHEEYPFLTDFNHTIAHIEVNGVTYLVDCGNIYRPVGILSVPALNSRGYLVKKKGSTWIDIIAPTSSQITVANLELSEDGSLKGKLEYHFKGNLAVEKRHETGNDESGNLIKNILSSKNPNWQIESISLKNLKNTNEVFTETIAINIPNAATINDDYIYLKPTLNSGWETNPFKQPKRFYPIEYPYPNNEQFILNLKIPQGYKIEELPKQLSAVVPPDAIRFQYFITEKDNSIALNVKINLKKTAFQTENYNPLRDFFGSIASKLNEQIVLKKVSK